MDAVSRLQRNLEDSTDRVEDLECKLQQAKNALRQTQGHFATKEQELREAQNPPEDVLAKMMAAALLEPARELEGQARKKYCVDLMRCFHPDKNPAASLSTAVSQALQEHELWHRRLDRANSPSGNCDE